METKDLLAVAVGAVGAVTAITTVALKALFEYRKQGVAHRSEMFLKMRSRLREDQSFKNICELLERDDKRLKTVPLVEKDRFMGFFEELALMQNSGLINDQVTLYMFGYFAVRCLDSANFWDGLNREHKLWALFIDFAKQMKTAERAFKYDRKHFHL